MEEFAVSECPDCKSSIETRPGFKVWCPSCNWNLKFEHPLKKPAKLDEIRIRLSEKRSRYIFEQISSAGTQQNESFNWVRALAITLSVLVLLFNFSLFCAGLYFLFAGPGHFIHYLVAFLLLATFWISRPRFDRIPQKEFIGRNECPELYRLADEVCLRFGTKPVEGIILNGEFNASISEYGPGRKKVLSLGLPLWSILSPGEKIDIVGHEIAHCVNNDPARSIIVNTAVGILVNTGNLLYPSRLVPDIDSGGAGIGAIFVELGKYAAVPLYLMLRGLARLLWFGAYAVCHLLWFDSQKSEYRADILAAELAGREAALGSMEKLGMTDFVQHETHRLSLKPNKELETFNIFDALDQTVRDLPGHEKLRLRRLMEFEKHQFEATHPPTWYRIQMLHKHAQDTGKLAPDNFDFNQMRSETQKHERRVQERLVDLRRAWLYY